MSHLATTAAVPPVGTVDGMAYSSDLTDEQWVLLEPVFNAPGKRGPKHGPDRWRVVDAMLYTRRAAREKFRDLAERDLRTCVDDGMAA